MLALIVSVCLRTDPSHCEEHVVNVIPAASVASCEAESGPALEGWVKGQPDYLVQSSRCISTRSSRFGH